jgi:hypothetical protein
MYRSKIDEGDRIRNLSESLFEEAIAVFYNPDA